MTARKGPIEAWEVPPPPEDLGEDGVIFWTPAAAQLRLDPRELTLLHQACRALDLMTQAWTLIQEEGLLTRDRFGKRISTPACKVYRDSEISFREALRALDLQNIPPRPAPPIWADDREPLMTGEFGG